MRGDPDTGAASSFAIMGFEMSKYELQPRLDISDIRAGTQAAEIAAEWTERARRLTAFVTAHLPPELPPITTYISSIEGQGGATKIR